MFQNFDDMQKVSKVNVDATMKSFEVVAKNVQAITTEITDYTKRSFENSTKTLEKLLGAKSLDMACTRFHRHRVRCFDGTGGESWRGGSLLASSS
jgi:hypothetical protein